MAQQYNFDINGAMKAGYTPEQIQQYLAQQQKAGNNYQLTPTPQVTPQQSQQPAQPKGNWFTDALPAIGGVVGGIGGALIPGLGETGIGEVGGAAFGSGLGETAKELITGQKLNPGEIGAQTAIGGVGGVLGKGVGYVAGKALSKVGQTAPVFENAATELAQGTRQIRVKPSVSGASQEKAINTTLDKYGVKGTAQQQYSRLQPTMKNIEGKINKVIQDNPDVGASRQDIENEFMKNLDSSLRSKDITAPQAKDEINGYLDDLLKAAPDKTEAGQVLDAQGNAVGSTTAASEGDNIPLGQLRALKKLVNEDYGPVYTKSQAGQALTPRQKVIMAAWDSLDQAVKNASPEVKGLLTDESNIYKSARSLSSARSNPPTLRVMGTSVPAPVTQAARDIAGGTLNAAGKGIARTPGGLPPLVSQSVGQGITRSFVPQNSQNSQDPNQYGQPDESQNSTTSNYNQNTLPPTPAQASSSNSTIGASPSQALPTSPNSFFQAQRPSGFMQGWTIKGQPVDENTKNLLWQVTNYRLDPLKMTSLKNNQREQLISMASQVDPNYTSSQYPVVEDTRKDYTSGKSAQTIRSLNTAIGHLNALAESGKALGNSQIPLINSAKNAIAQGSGQPGVGRFNTTANAVAGEMATVFKNSGATDDEIKTWRQQLDPNMSPAQLQTSISQMIELMGSRLNALQTQYEANIGKPTDFSFLSPESQKILQGLGIDPSSLTSQQK